MEMSRLSAAFLAASAISLLLVPVQSRVLSRCKMARILEEAGFRKSLIPDWICLIESESGRNTTARGGPNKNDSYDHGLFQINDRYWCTMGEKGKDCNVSCEELEGEDLEPIFRCVRKIFARHGFHAWHGWTRKCKGKKLPEVDDCFHVDTTTTTEYPEVDLSTPI